MPFQNGDQRRCKIASRDGLLKSSIDVLLQLLFHLVLEGVWERAGSNKNGLHTSINVQMKPYILEFSQAWLQHLRELLF